MLADDVELEAGACQQEDKRLLEGGVGRRRKRKREIYSPVLVYHIGNAETLINDLAPTVAIKILAAELTGAEVPGRTVAICGIFK
jgi:hypothetical protein